MSNFFVTRIRNFLADRIRVSDGAASTVRDGYFNPLTRVGLGAGNLNDGSAYQMTPITRQNLLLHTLYRTSWIAKKVVDSVADDMVRAGVEFTGLPSGESRTMERRLVDFDILNSIRTSQKWARLFGGSIAVMLFDGHSPMVPLSFSAIQKNSFRGLYALDRWYCNPSYNDVIKTVGQDMGLPRYYRILNEGRIYPGQSLHHSRVLRMEGIKLPPLQAQWEYEWGLSVVEPLYDRLINFDSATLGASQLVNRAYLRIMKVKGYNQAASMLGDARRRDSPLAGIFQAMEGIRAMASNEGMTVIDSENDLTALNYTFTGISDILIQLGQQISGATGIPMVRLFGQSPAGLNATGESDMRQYYDGVGQEREGLRNALMRVFTALYISEFGKAPPDGFGFEFGSLYESSEVEKEAIASQRTNRVNEVFESGLITKPEALEELRKGSEIDGAWSTITQEMINAAQKEADEAPLPDELAEPPLPSSQQGNSHGFNQKFQRSAPEEENINDR